jgi:Tol biopolymer transport system component
MATVRRVDGKDRLEFPMGKVLYETAGWVSHPRISLDGKTIAFIDHAFERDDAGTVATVDLSGSKKTLSEQFVSAQGLAWSVGGNEVWYTATTSGSSRELRAVSLAGKERLVYLGTGTLTFHDISKDGRVLFTRDDLRAGMIALAPGDKKERDLSWHDWTVPRDLSNDGKLISFDETGEAGGETGALYVRGSDGSPAVRLGEGRTPTLSPDGKWVIARAPGARHELLQLPTGAGESRTISTGDVLAQNAFFFPDGRHLLEIGNTEGHGLRLWIQDSQGGPPQPISPEGAMVRRRQDISPDGKLIVARDPEGQISVYPVAGGKAMQVPKVEPGEEPVQWTPDGKGVIVGRREVPARTFIINLASGERKLMQSFMPADPTGLFGNASPNFSTDLKSYVYSYQRITSDLYVVDGLK